MEKRMTAVEFHPCGPYEYVVTYYGELIGKVGRYPPQRV